MNRIWIVWRENGGAQAFAHKTIEEAKLDAERLSRLNPGVKFYVLSSWGYCITPKPGPMWTIGPQTYCEPEYTDDIMG